MSQDDMESRVYSTMSTEQGFKLYDLTQKMREQAEWVKSATPSHDPDWVLKVSKDLADMVEEFLKVSGWVRK